jgi:epoxyqueuosine reductase
LIRWQTEQMTQASAPGRQPTWVQKRERWDALRRQPSALQALSERLAQVGRSEGLAAVGITTAAPLLDARQQIIHRVENGLHADMVFTFARPERSTTPARLLPGAASIVVGAWPYRAASPTSQNDTDHGEVARYQWEDHYGALRQALKQVAGELKRDGWRARVLADDNSLVDRAVAHRAGIGWFGKNANLLLPGLGSWFVLGSIITDAPLPTATEPVADGCGSCTRCIPACPTDAIVAPGVIDARRCLAWLVQAPGDIPEQYRVAMGARIYGCDDCQTACPENRVLDRRDPPKAAPPHAVSLVDLRSMLQSTDAKLLHDFGRWWIPDRNPNVLRRNAVVALGNIGDPNDQSLRELLVQQSVRDDAMVSRHADWSLRRLDHRRTAPSGH